MRCKKTIEMDQPAFFQFLLGSMTWVAGSAIKEFLSGGRGKFYLAFHSEISSMDTVVISHISHAPIGESFCLYVL